METRAIKIGINHYCWYCLEKSKESIDRDSWDKTYYCNCDGAKAELELDRIISEFHNKKMIQDVKKLNKLMFEHELEQLKRKYKI